MLITFWEMSVSLNTCSHRVLAIPLDVMFIVIGIYHAIFEDLSTTTVIRQKCGQTLARVRVSWT